jgi:acyl carrier protein
MSELKEIIHTDVEKLVLASLQNVLAQKETVPLNSLSESTYLIGNEQVLDSLGLVTLILDVEQDLENEYGISLSLADDRAMSQSNSPFRTVGSLVHYICSLAKETRHHDGT